MFQTVELVLFLSWLSHFLPDSVTEAFLSGHSDDQYEQSVVWTISWFDFFFRLSNVVLRRTSCQKRTYYHTHEISNTVVWKKAAVTLLDTTRALIGLFLHWSEGNLYVSRGAVGIQ